MKYVLFLFYILILATHLYPAFGAIDKIGFQWMYLSIVFFFIFNTLIISNRLSRDELIVNFKSNLKSYVPLFFFISISFISITYSYNKSEAIITSSRYLINFLILFYFLFFFQRINSKKVFESSIIVLLALELFVSFAFIYNDIKNDAFILRKPIYSGLTGNVNILTSLILPKIPILLYRLFYTKSKALKVFLFLLLHLSAIVIFSLGSRISFVVFSFYIFFFTFWIFRTISLKPILKKSIFTLFLIILFKVNFSVVNYIENSSNQDILNQRLESTIALNGSDDSINSRIRYFKHSLEMFLENPIIGLGSGNWKIESIKYDRKNIRNYVVPYHSHNDFLQILAELGALGLLSYIIFLLMPLIKLIKNIKSFNSNYFIFFLMSFIAFLLDSAINFPIARPVNQILFLAFYAFIISYKPVKNEK